MASDPATVTNRGTPGASAAAKQLSAMLHSSTMPSSTAAPDAWLSSAVRT